jgi:hypothetical protein
MKKNRIYSVIRGLFTFILGEYIAWFFLVSIAFVVYLISLLF